MERTAETKPSGPLHLRGYHREDLDALFRLDELCFEPAFRFSKADMRRYAEVRYSRVVVGEIDRELAGFCIIHLMQLEGDPSAYVVTLDVAPEHRRSGVASALMAQSEREAREEGSMQMLLHVFADNDAAISFYQRSGYQLAGQAKHFYGRGRHGLIYRKELSKSAPEEPSSLAS